MSNDGPPLIRPVPRRPFDLNLTGPTPPSDNSASPSPNPNSSNHPELQSALARLLSPRPASGANGGNLAGANAATPQESGASAGTISRSQSIMNLTASTLFGIYSPASRRDRFDREELDTPWGTGAETPVKRRPSVDEPTFGLMKDRSSPLRRRRSSWPYLEQQHRQASPPLSTAMGAVYLGSRVVLLFLLGMGYGALVSRLQQHEEEQPVQPVSMESVMRLDHDWAKLALWGFSGVTLGVLLPWFDGVWADAFGRGQSAMEEEDDDESRSGFGTDWALVVRSIGAFVGIVFAIRKLPWASTLQVSLTLALVNPFLWYLIDRSKPGLLLSAAVGVAGSAVLMGVNPEIMPTPSALLHHQGNNITADEGPPLQGGTVAALGGLTSQETLETGIWMLSVLFCSCVCFGNIGRRLALSTPSAARTRCGGSKTASSQ